MKGFKLLFILPLLVGCAIETTYDSEEEVITSNDYTPNKWIGQEDDTLICRPYYRELTVNGQTIVVYEPAECPFLPSPDEVINPVEERVNPVDKYVNPIGEHIVAEKEFIR